MRRAGWAWHDGEKEILVAIVKKHTATHFEIKQSLYPEWRMPIIKFHYRKGSMDWEKPQRYSALPP